MNVYAVLAFQIFLASLTHIIAKSVVRDVDPLALTCMRGLISAVGFFGILLLRRTKISLKSILTPSILIVGFLATFNQFIYLYGMKYTTAANGALLYATSPILVLILSRFLLKEKITAMKLLGIVLAFIGVVLVIFERGIDTSSEFLLGNIMVFIAVLTWSLYTIYGRPLVLQHGALPATALANFAGLVLLLPFGAYSSCTYPIDNLAMNDWYGIIYLGVGTSVVGYLLWYYALRRIEASRLAVFANGQPIVTALLSIVFLQATITMQFIIGGSITLCGVILTQKK